MILTAIVRVCVCDFSWLFSGGKEEKDRKNLLFSVFSVLLFLFFVVVDSVCNFFDTTFTRRAAVAVGEPVFFPAAQFFRLSSRSLAFDRIKHTSTRGVKKAEKSSMENFESSELEVVNGPKFL